MTAQHSGSGAISTNNGGGIDKLDYHPGRPLLRPDDNGGGAGGNGHEDTSYAGSFFEHVAEGIVDRDRAKMRREVLRYFSFCWAVLEW